MSSELPDPITLIIALGALGLVPFIAIMVTSFVKLSIVLSLVRNALGVQQIPPNMAIHGLAIILTLYIMAPVGLSIHAELTKPDSETGQTRELSISDPAEMLGALETAALPFKAFLLKHVDPSQQAFFKETTTLLWPKEQADLVAEDSYFVLIPAFTISELTAAFEIGFLIYLPFLVIDLIISNILLAMGMMMVSPMTISLPFKLFLFVMVDGWTRLIHGLVLTYQ